MNNHNTLFIIMGVSGCGKSTIGTMLAKKLNIPFYDGDDFHPRKNILKMEAGEALNDDDRKPWLEKINSFAKDNINESSLIIACSALKQNYRTLISEGLKTKFIYLKGTAELILDRLNKREGHFMPPALLSSQFEILEEPENEIIVDISGETAEIIEIALKKINS